ncbi:EF-hand domain-containing protein [Nocardia sp. alder85J]|uniref:EF-hand domain-containing protein n=1 Tax=Nocardia sp. alder85J TaxID=2862949 RepID=UPI001CD560B0|nr:EF-hand domain-containing protein [Nocardia sp. alder85J]MCX4094620.1 EF-hand domain-containing protein [Nocardia sp. alder85J]
MGNLEEQFGAADRNGDGRIDIKEYTAWKGATLGRALTADDLDKVFADFIAADTDEDGTLAFTEFETIAGD